MPKKLVVLSGAGISAESGISTFRDAGGLWEGHDIMEVASPQGWHKNRELVLDFYNKRRQQALKCKPNAAHAYLQKLEAFYDVTIITQNIDNLHEKAGSKNVIHLHGEMFKSRSTLNEHLVYDINGWELKLGDKCEKGSQLRPHIVWFGEMVPMMEVALAHVLQADVFIVVGTSLVVYPAAGLVNYVPNDAPIYVIDPKLPAMGSRQGLKQLEMPATKGMASVYEELVAMS